MVKKRILPAALILLTFVLGLLGSFLLLRNLSTILLRVVDSLSLAGSADETVRGIVSQLAHSTLRFAWLLSAGIAVLFAALRFALPPNSGGWTAVYILAAILLWLLCVLAALLLSRLGGIRILDIATSVGKLIRGGIFEVL